MPSNTLPISTIVLAHLNTAKLIATLKSVSWSKEIILVWTSSQPLSDEVATYPGVRVVLQPGHIHDFSALRNQAIAEATQPWTFFVDSDEVVISSGEQIASAISGDVDGITVQRRDIFLGKEMKWGEVGNVSVLRLFRTSKGKFSRSVHEVAEVSGPVMHSSLLLEHTSHDSISQFFAKIAYYSQLEAKHRYEHHESVTIVQIILWPKAKFIVNYFFRLGILDGWRGVIYALFMSFHSFALRIQLYEMNHADQK